MPHGKKRRLAKKDRLRILKRQYDNRDFEIANLWQRSIFLVAFITLLSSGYGALWLAAFKHCRPISEFHPVGFNIVGVILSIMLFVFSVLWITMARGSKYWYEVYENKIKKMERGLVPYCMRNSDPGLDNGAFLSFKRWRYSPSKINIAIGFVWAAGSMAAMLFHLCRLHYVFFPNGICVIFRALVFGLVLTASLSACLAWLVHDFAKSEN